MFGCALSVSSASFKLCTPSVLAGITVPRKRFSPSSWRLAICSMGRITRSGVSAVPTLVSQSQPVNTRAIWLTSSCV